ncbi:MAG: translocation/assembly module TamB domain-containing protein [Cytophagaceae bacterium]
MFLLLGLFTLVMILYFVIRIPRVQQYALQHITVILENELDTKVDIGELEFDPLRQIVLRNIYVEDQQGDTLLYANRLRVDFDILDLFKKTIRLELAELDQAKVNIYKQEGMEDFNYQFLLYAFESDEPSEPSDWLFQLEKISLSSINLNYLDVPGGTRLAANMQRTVVDIEDLGLEKNHLILNYINLHALDMRLEQLPGRSIVEKDDIIEAESEPEERFFVTIYEIDITGSAFAFNDLNEPGKEAGLDPNHLHLTGISGNFENILLHGDLIKGSIQQLAMREKSGLELNRLTLDLALDGPELDLNISALTTGNSHFDKELSIHIPQIDKVGDEIGEIRTHADFRNTLISFKDLLVFDPKMDIPDDFKDASVHISGDLRGKVADIQFNNFDIRLEDHVLASGSLTAIGLPEADRAKFNITFTEAEAKKQFLHTFYPPKKDLPVNLYALGDIRTKGTIEGSLHDVTVKLQTGTDLGGLRTNVRIKTDNDFNPLAHSGTIDVQNFHMGRFLESEEMGRLTANATFKGRGENMDSFNVNLRSFLFNDYTYRNIIAEGSFVNNLLLAELSSEDPNIESYLSTQIDLREDQFKYMVNGVVCNANLHALNFTEDTLQFSTRINIDLAGTDPDSITGFARLDNFHLRQGRQTYKLDSLQLTSEINERDRLITINSPIINGKVSGVFTYSDIPDATKQFISNFTDAYAFEAPDAHMESMYFNFNVDNLDKLLSVFAPDINIFDNFNVSGSYREENQSLEIKGSMKEFRYKDQHLKNLDFTVDAKSDSLNFLVKGSSLDLGGFVIDTPSINGNFFNDKLSFNLIAAQKSSQTYVNMDGLLTHRRDTFALTLPRAEIQISGHDWNIKAGNQILYSDEYLAINDLELFHEDQRILVHTRRQANTKDLIELQMERISLEDIAKITNTEEYKMKGRLSGEIDVIDPLSALGIDADIRIDSVLIADEPLGKISLTAKKAEYVDQVSAGMRIAGPGNDMVVRGFYDFGQTPDSINAHVTIREFAIGRAEPFLKDVFTKMDGNIIGNLHIRGSTDAPKITGNLMFKDENILGLAITQTQYTIKDQEIFFEEEAIRLNNFTLRDNRGRPAVANGFIRHKQFDDMVFDLKFSADRFRLIDSPEAREAVFYGTLIATVDMGLKGPIEDLDIRVNITSEPGTNLTLQILPDENMVRPPYIVFKDDNGEDEDRPFLSESETGEGGRVPQFDMSRFDFRSQIKITPEAVFNIVIDPVNGDMITARGTGDISMRMDADQNVNLFGTYTINEGLYSLRFLNLMKREFSVRSGSTISWSGDPESPSLNLTAVYETRASRIDLVPDLLDIMTVDEIRAARRALPVRVLMKMSGELEEPALSFDLEVPEATASADAAVVNQRIDQIRADETQLNKQVFGLIVLNRFIYDGVGTTDTGEDGILLGQASQSISRVLNRQLETLSDQYLAGIELEVNVEALDQRQGAFAQEVELMATRQITDRISVSAGGTVNVGAAEGSGQFAGDYAVRYRVNEAGNINLRFFRTSRQDMFTDHLRVSTGASINHHKDFDRLRDLLPW